MANVVLLSHHIRILHCFRLLEIRPKVGNTLSEHRADSRRLGPRAGQKYLLILKKGCTEEKVTHQTRNLCKSCIVPLDTDNLFEKMTSKYNEMSLTEKCAKISVAMAQENWDEMHLDAFDLCLQFIREKYLKGLKNELREGDAVIYIDCNGKGTNCTIVKFKEGSGHKIDVKDENGNIFM